MKNNLLVFITIFTINNAFSQTICTNGFAGIYPCNKVDLMSQLSFSQIGGNNSTEGSSCWGWTDPLNGKEYAIMGCTTHTAFVDITVPSAPIYLGKLNSHNDVSSIWREMKVYNNYAYIVSEANGHGMQIFDLTRLRNVTSPQIFIADARYSGFGNCHTITINEATGFAYCNGTSFFQGGANVLNIQNPLNPVFVLGYPDEDYTHDSQAVIYNGPDPDYQGKEIFIGANETKVVIVDVTDKANPILISNFLYSNTGYTHQGWFTPDQKYWILGDEIDELDFGFNSRSIIIDMTDLDNPVLKGEYFGPTAAIDHNGYCKGNDFYLANYTAGLRIMNTTSITATNTMNEIGFFDTYPENNNAQFKGAWSTYPYFPSGSIIISDINRGLFVLRKNASLSNEEFLNSNYTIYPNPAKTFFSIDSNIVIESITIYDSLGKTIKKLQSAQNYDVSDLEKGLYFVRINNDFTKKIIVE
jgi:choice-of-anchor B domain-containing protein